MRSNSSKIRSRSGTGRKLVAAMVSSLMFLALSASISHADNAEVLPRGVSRIGLNSKFYLPVNKQYDRDGNVVDVADDYNTNLNSNVFPDLALLEQAFGLPAGSATLGTSDVSFDYFFDLFEVAYQYGLTDRVTLGIMIPYWRVRNRVNARLDTSNATIGKNPAVPGGLAPLGFPGTVPLTTNDVKSILGKGLDVNGDGQVDIKGFGYRRFESWDQESLSDIEVGFRYQYLTTDSWRLAFTGGVRFPTGREDDPDNLIDRGFGDGVYVLLFRLHNDFTGIKNLVLDLTLGYDLLLPDKNLDRIPSDVNHPITTNKERVDRDLGDVIGVEVSGTYEFLEGFSVTLLYTYIHGFQDQISGDKGFAYDSLQQETNYQEHIFIGGLSYSTVPLFRQKKFPIPMTVGLFYRDRFAGQNALKSQYIGLNLAVFF